MRHELVIEVQGTSSTGSYVYPESRSRSPTLVLPVDRPVKLELVSFDVNHRWWVPEITGKRDAIRQDERAPLQRPRRKASTRPLRRVCGVLHTVMPTTGRVVSQAEYDSHLQLLSGQDQPGATHSPRPGDVGPVCAKSRARGGGRSRVGGRQNGTLATRRRCRAARGRPEHARARGIHAAVARGWPGYQVQAWSRNRVEPSTRPAQAPEQEAKAVAVRTEA